MEDVGEARLTEGNSSAGREGDALVERGCWRGFLVG